MLKVVLMIYIIQDNGKVPKIPDTSDIFEKIMKMKGEKDEKTSMVA